MVFPSAPSHPNPENGMRRRLAELYTIAKKQCHYENFLVLAASRHMDALPLAFRVQRDKGRNR